MVLMLVSFDCGTMLPRVCQWWYCHALLDTMLEAVFPVFCGAPCLLQWITYTAIILPIEHGSGWCQTVRL
jgi:hypothetical protein